MAAELRYSAAPSECLAVTALDALTAVFDRRSGQTHLLAAPLPEILAALGDQRWTLPDFSAHLADQFEISSDDGDAGAIIAARLAELAELGLVDIG